MRMQRKTQRLIFIVVLIAAAIALPMLWSSDDNEKSADQNTAVKPALTVTVTSPQQANLPVKVSANGNIMAWQEASIGAEVNGLRLDGVLVNVGDKVKRGQVLAVFASDTVEAELAQSIAAVDEAQASMDEATANGQRARSLQTKGALSAQQIQQYLSTESGAKARLASAKAVAKSQRLRLGYTQVIAPDDGVISARNATVGAVVPAGQELFRLIRQGRLEWRAEVASADLAKLQTGQVAHVSAAGGLSVQGTLRIVGPVVDTQTRNGLVYVDLPLDSDLRAGMFARGEFEITNSSALTLPQNAVMLRDGFSYVLRIETKPNSTQTKVIQTKIITGRRAGERIEIIEGIELSTQVVSSGVGFLGDGDLVKVVSDETAPQEAK